MFFWLTFWLKEIVVARQLFQNGGHGLVGGHLQIVCDQTACTNVQVMRNPREKLEFRASFSRVLFRKQENVSVKLNGDVLARWHRLHCVSFEFGSIGIFELTQTTDRMGARECGCWLTSRAAYRFLVKCFWKRTRQHYNMYSYNILCFFFFTFWKFDRSRFG